MLKADGAGETGYARCGLLVVAVSEDEQGALAETRHGLPPARGGPEPPSAGDACEASPEEARRLFRPPISA